jgi:cardiolipin synthase
MASNNPDGSKYSWRFFYRPLETWEAMYRDCLNAGKSIEFEQYILENDAVGRRFMELFIEKAKAGVKIFLICDRFGSSLLSRSSLVRKLRRHGGRLHFYNDFNGGKVFMPWRWFPRTHTKTLLIDSTIAYTGGVCMAERMRHWRDTHVRITGPVVAEIRQAFDDIENRILGEKTKGIPERKKDHRFLYFLSRPKQERYAVYEEFEKAIAGAKRYIYITSAFFIPNRRFLALLKQAYDRGVDVRVLVPERSDVILADWVCLSYTPNFFAAGLRIFHYQATVLHSKTAIIDDHWGTVGSTNFDVISFFHNREANIMTTDAEAIAELKQQFFADLHCSKELTKKEWGKIPLWKKIVGRVARILKAFF